MREKLIKLGMVVLMTLFVHGCGSKSVGVNGNVSDHTEVKGDTVSINEDPYGSQGNRGSSGGYNSSSDGFESIYFAFGAYSIESEMQGRMELNARVAQNKRKRIKIEGNCDEFGTDEYNYALGLKRAKVVKDALVAQGVASNKMVLVSLGESSPVCNDGTSECYEQNRRVDLHLVR